MLRLWTRSNWNSSWSTKTLSFARITIARKRNNVSYCWVFLNHHSEEHVFNTFVFRLSYVHRAKTTTTDKQVFKDLDFLGWYTTGNRPTDQDIKIHKQICEINECPIMLQLSPQSRNFDVSSVNYWQSSRVARRHAWMFIFFSFSAIAGENLWIGHWYCPRWCNNAVCQFVIHIGHRRSRTNWCRSCGANFNTWTWWQISW